MKKPSFAVAVLALAAATSFDAAAVSSVLYTGSLDTVSSSVRFDLLAGQQLQVVLSNTSFADTLVPSNVLTGVFFNIAGNPSLTRISAISGGSTYKGTATVSGIGTTVGGEWAYLNGLSQYGANEGISSSGLGIFGPKNMFPGANLADTASPGGVEYGIASMGDLQATGNKAITGTELTKGSVSFLLGALPANFNLASITKVTFQYGTSLSEPHFAGLLQAGGTGSSGTGASSAGTGTTGTGATGTTSTGTNAGTATGATGTTSTGTTTGAGTGATGTTSTGTTAGAGTGATGTSSTGTTTGVGTGATGTASAGTTAGTGTGATGTTSTGTTTGAGTGATGTASTGTSATGTTGTGSIDTGIFSAGAGGLGTGGASIVVGPVSPVPEPATVGMMVLGLFGIAAERRRRQRLSC